VRVASWPKENKTLSKLLFLVVAFCVFLPGAVSAHAQQFDIGFGFGTVLGTSVADTQSGHIPQSISGGGYPAFSGDFQFWKKSIGVGGEVAWRARQNVNIFFQPYRPILYDFNAVFGPPLGKHAQAVVMGGIGGLDIRFYQPVFTCNFFGCTNFSSSQHFLTHVGGGVRFYIWHSVFVMPEAHFYYVNNNFEFAGNRVQRYGATLGYSLKNRF
jgi:hypothetical protein